MSFCERYMPWWLDWTPKAPRHRETRAQKYAREQSNQSEFIYAEYVRTTPSCEERNPSPYVFGPITFPLIETIYKTVPLSEISFYKDLLEKDLEQWKK